MLDLSSNPSFPGSNNSPRQVMVLDSNVIEGEPYNNSPQKDLVLDSSQLNMGGNNSPQKEMVLD